MREEMGARCVWMKLGRLQNVQNLNIALVCDSTAHHGNGAAGIPGVPTASVDPTQHRYPISQLIKAQPCLRVTQVMNPLQGACWL